jgi:hypothetical protein
MSQSYVNDVFISYSHQGAVHKWVHQHLYGLIQDWLPNYLPYQPKIFIDEEEIKPGTQWPPKLRRELKMSRSLLAIWSRSYFDSHWCTAEFESFRARENMLKLRTEQEPSGLIYPILFTSPPEYLPPKVKKIQYQDLSEYAYTSEGFKRTVEYLDFEKEVKELCRELANMILGAPDWRDNWPIRMPKSSPKAPYKSPRVR